MQAERAVRGSLEWSTLGHRVYHETTQRATTHVWKMFYYKVLKPPERQVHACELTADPAAELMHTQCAQVFASADPVELAHFYNIEEPRLKDVLRDCTGGGVDTQRQLRRMRRMLYKVRADLSKIYRHYSHSGMDGGSGTALTSLEFWVRAIRCLCVVCSCCALNTHVRCLCSGSSRK